ncbi:MAG TPA: DUF2255 family protein [Cellulomonadaceae bacterium]|nr:DUF2255 family protein [Cellulomonadaceae bacterium]
MVIATWSSDDLRRVGSSDELQISARRTDGNLSPWLPIWVVCVGEQVYVRTWYRRATGWFAQVLDSRRASIRVPGLQADVAVEDAAGRRRLQADIDAAYVTKYPRYGTPTVGRMVTAAAAATTLRLDPECECCLAAH